MIFKKLILCLADLGLQKVQIATTVQHSSAQAYAQN
jgi:hypothetical protein